MRREASVLHLDLDAFFASVEQRDKPSLRGKPVVVGGIGQRGVVATASYEARVFGVRSAMPAHEARRRCPHAAFLAGRFAAYRAASDQVMRLLRELSPLVEPLSLDEAFVDLRAAPRPLGFSRDEITARVAELKAQVAAATGGLTASVGVATSKFMAKVATELAKPNGLRIVEPGTEVALLGPMPVGVIPGVGPVTAGEAGADRHPHRRRPAGVRDATSWPRSSARRRPTDWSSWRTRGTTGPSSRSGRPSRSPPRTPSRPTSATPTEQRAVLLRQARQVATRLGAAGLFGRTVSIKVRLPDFATYTRSRTLTSATDAAETIGAVAVSLLGAVNVAGGVRLLGVGVAGLTDLRQAELFADEAEVETVEAVEHEQPRLRTEPAAPDWRPGFDVEHDEHGRGWVWGAGLGRVTVRFETRDTPPGPVRTFATDDPALRRVDPA